MRLTITNRAGMRRVAVGTGGLLLLLVVAVAGLRMKDRPGMPVPAAGASMPQERGGGEPTPLQRAQAALQAGDDPAAQAAFRQVLSAQPENAVALRGLAVVNARLGLVPEAEAGYLKLLQQDGQDLQAQDGLIALQAQGADARQTEIRLQALLAAHPEFVFLNYGLGNLYVSLERWEDAQLAFLKAYRADPEHPDYLFSLAVSLDYLGKTPMAQRMYTLALKAAEKRPARFGRSQARARLAELERDGE